MDENDVKEVKGDLEAVEASPEETTMQEKGPELKKRYSRGENQKNKKRRNEISSERKRCGLRKSVIIQIEKMQLAKDLKVGEDNGLVTNYSCKRDSMGNKSDQRKFVCQTCGARFSFQRWLNRHMKTHKEADEVLEPTRRSGSSTRNNRRSLALVLRFEEPEEEMLDLEIVDIEICQHINHTSQC